MSTTAAPYAQWTQRDTEVALQEGWMVFNGCEIQRDDEADTFDSDDAAVEHVRQRAAQGHPTHVLALSIHNSCD